MAAVTGIEIRNNGDLRTTEKFLQKCISRKWLRLLNRFGEEGVTALAAATPKDTGETAASWSYEIIQNKGSVSIQWYNSHLENGNVNVAVILQYGHGTRNGGYVQGVDYINPALRPIFEKILTDVWNEVKSNG